MAAIAICIADARLRAAVVKSLRGIAPATAIHWVSSARELATLLGKLGLLIAEWPMIAGAEDPICGHETALLVLASEDQAVEALRHGACAVLPSNTGPEAIAAAALATLRGFAVLPRPLLDSLLEALPSDDHKTIGAAQVEMPSLTPRELEVLAALADGASNKLIARRLGISFHTAKFHVAALLEKLDADSRTEAVAKGARLGLVML